MRKELRGVLVRASRNVVDRFFPDTHRAQLMVEQRREVPVRFGARTIDQVTARRRGFYLVCNVVADLEGITTDVRTDGHDQLAWVASERIDRASHDVGHCTAPSCVDGGNITAHRVRNENGYAVGRPRRDPDARRSNDESVTFEAGNFITLDDGFTVFQEIYKDIGPYVIEGDYVELEYEEIADYPAGQTFSPQQRVAFACELYDNSAIPLSPQEAIQNLPISTSMTFLSISNEIKLPIIVRQ